MRTFEAIDNKTVTLVDQIENQLLTYFKNNKFQIGDEIPNETELANALGVSRSALREALSRLKMMGLIESRARRGMVIKEPSLLGGMKKIIAPWILCEKTLLDLLGFRVSLEIGISEYIFANITSEDIQELETIVRMGKVLGNNEYPMASEYMFHSKLYQITQNNMIAEFQDIIHPVLNFIKDKFREVFEPINMQLERQDRLVSHSDLLDHIKAGDKEGYRKAIEQHFLVYNIFLKMAKSEK